MNDDNMDTTTAPIDKEQFSKELLLVDQDDEDNEVSKLL